MNIIKILIIILCFSFITINSIQIQKFRNNWLRLYIQAYNKEKQRISLNAVCVKLYNKIYDKVNIYLIQINQEYYLLSDEEKMILETICSLMY
jgi:hypothetical protein